MVPIVDPQKKYWVIRADGGFYFNHFLRNGFVALSHIDDLQFSMESINSEILNAISLLLPYSEKTSRQNQVFRFIDKVKINDWVITIGKKDIAIGIIKSEPFFDGSGFDNKEYLLGLRRLVEWGQVIKRNDIPYDLQTALKCNQSLFNIDKYHESIYHTLFPFFIKGSKLHTSLKIKTQSNIRTKDIIKLFELIDDIDVFCKKSLNSESNNSASSFIKAQFKSPGDIWAIYNDIKTNVPGNVFWFIGAYIAIFGNKYVGFDGIFDKESRHKILDFAIDYMKNKKSKESINNLKIELPESDFYSKIPNSEKLRIEPTFLPPVDESLKKN